MKMYYTQNVSYNKIAKKRNFGDNFKIKKALLRELVRTVQFLKIQAIMFNWILLKIDMGFLEVDYFNFLCLVLIFSFD